MLEFASEFDFYWQPHCLRDGTDVYNSNRERGKIVGFP